MAGVQVEFQHTQAFVWVLEISPLSHLYSLKEVLFPQRSSLGNSLDSSFIMGHSCFFFLKYDLASISKVPLELYYVNYNTHLYVISVAVSLKDQLYHFLLLPKIF